LKHGDVDCDDEITLGDAEDLLAHLGGLPTGPTPDGCPDIGGPAGSHIAGDLDCDGLITGKDVLVALIDFAGADQLPLPSGCPAPGAIA
jgi:hypothetical protein